MSKRLTLKEVAELAGVSRTTASRVLNERGEVSPEVRKRVNQVIKEHNYRPMSVARNLASRRAGLLGVVLPLSTADLFSDPYFARLFQSLSAHSTRSGSTIALFLLDDLDVNQPDISNLVEPGRIDGFILLAYHTHDSLNEVIAQAGMPAVVMGSSSQSYPMASVSVDNYRGGYLAGEHLLSCGATRIATIAGPQDTISGLDRLRGFRDALAAAGVELGENSVIEGDYTAAAGQHCMEVLIGDEYDGVFVASDTMAVGALRALEDAGVRVPHDLQLVGYDDLPSAAQQPIPLTTVRQPIDEMAHNAINILNDLIDDPSKVKEISLSVELIPRETTRQKSNEKINY